VTIRISEELAGPATESATVIGSRVDVALRREAMTRADWTTHDYNVHFSVGLQNDGAVDTDALVSVEGGEWDKLPTRSPLIYGAASPDGPWTPCDFAARTDLKKRYAIRVPLRSGERRFIANTLPRRLGDLQLTFDELATRGGARRVIYGKSLEGRELVAYCYGNSDRATVLVTSGFHPPEPDTLSAEAIMAWLAEDGAGTVLSQLAVVVVPVVNPDGYAHQTQGSNAAGVNLFWDFRAEDERRCPEAAALWRFAADLAPRGYIDFHAYTFQLDKVPGPYCRPLGCYRDKAVREAAQSLYSQLSTASGSAPVFGFSTYAPATLGSRLNRRFDTLTVAKYHVHLKEGADGCRDRGVAVFRGLVETLISRGLTAQSTIAAQSSALVERSRVWWAGLVRPTLGSIRRGRFGDINVRRSGLVLPRVADSRL